MQILLEKSPYQIAKGAGIEVPKDTKVLVFKRKWNRDRISIFKRKVKPCFSILHCRKRR